MEAHCFETQVYTSCTGPVRSLSTALYAVLTIEAPCKACCFLHRLPLRVLFSTRCQRQVPITNVDGVPLQMDPFSTAAAAISVLSLAIQLVDTVQKVKEFWKSIKDAPADVSDIVNELDCILSILQELGEQDGERGPPGNVLVVKALQACGIYVRRLAACVRDLNPGLASGKGVRTWTSLKVVLRRERIQSSQEALERVKSNLILAQLIRQEYATP